MNISIIGGDLRIVELAKTLRKHKENQIYIYGMEECEDIKDINQSENLKQIVEKSEEIITSIPLSKDGITINSPYSNKKIYIKDLFEYSKNKKIITGNITDEIKSNIKDLNSNKIIDVMELEELAILNSIPTAEGAIQIAMQKSKITIHNSCCLVMGFGRIGKILAKMLNGLGANVFCEARKKKDIAYIKSYGYNAIELSKLNDYLNKFDFIFNTIPYIILNKDNLNFVNKECFIIDLASKPGGIDFDYANKLNLQTEWALALPGKVAPKTAANYLYEIIQEV